MVNYANSEDDLVQVILIEGIDNTPGERQHLSASQPTSILEAPISSTSSMLYLLEALSDSLWRDTAKPNKSQLELDPTELHYLSNLLDEDERVLDLLGRRILSLQGNDLFQDQLHQARRRISEDFHSIHGWSTPIASGSNVLVEYQERSSEAHPVEREDEEELQEIEELVYHSLAFTTSSAEEALSRAICLEMARDLEIDWLAQEILGGRDRVWILESDGYEDGISFPSIEALQYEVYEPSPSASPKRGVEVESVEEGPPRKTVKVHDLKKKE